jgi:hypothetical protein
MTPLAGENGLEHSLPVHCTLQGALNNMMFGTYLQRFCNSCSGIYSRHWDSFKDIRVKEYKIIPRAGHGGL